MRIKSSFYIVSHFSWNNQNKYHGFSEKSKATNSTDAEEHILHSKIYACHSNLSELYWNKCQLDNTNKHNR